MTGVIIYSLQESYLPESCLKPIHLEDCFTTSNRLIAMNSRLFSYKLCYQGGSELFVYGFTIKIKMLGLAKVLTTAFLKESAFTKHLQSICLSIFSSKPKYSTLDWTWVRDWRHLKNTKHMPSSMILNCGLTTVYLSIFRWALLISYKSFSLRVQHFWFAIECFKLF